MTAPSVICQSANGTIVPGADCGLSPQAADKGFADWQDLMKFRPSDAIETVLESRFQTAGLPTSIYHDIRKGWGPVNLDFYPVYIHDLPTVDGAKLSATELLSYLRKNAYRFMAHDQLSFDSYEQADWDRWQTDDPLGAVMHFHIGTKGATIDFTNNPDNMAVVAAESTQDHWIFSTIWSPSDLGHPVSGNRQFGIATRRPSDQFAEPYSLVFSDPVAADTLYFYTRGVDRCTTALDLTLSNTVFSGGHACWVGLCSNVQDWINANGGNASIPGLISDRHDWDQIRKFYLFDSVSY
jgi:hypothetical protein